MIWICFILFYFVLLYFILFYFILFDFTFTYFNNVFANPAFTNSHILAFRRVELNFVILKTTSNDVLMTKSNKSIHTLQKSEATFYQFLPLSLSQNEENNRPKLNNADTVGEHWNKTEGLWRGRWRKINLFHLLVSL